ncbi:MAG: substrate-binding domain-containing protein [Proteobacteria bacterium]|nr:substrate-binding domain-containing protein [Pseudomonadota bacterium]
MTGLALAQQKPAPPSHPGASTAVPLLPTANITVRPELFIVGSSTMKGYVDVTAAALQRDYDVPAPKVSFKGSKTGIAEFCAGIGPDYPDIAVSSRGMHKSEFDRCNENGILDIIEIKIGLSAYYVATKKGNPVFNVTPRMFYYALAEQLPKQGEFDDNPNQTWRQTDKSAPDLPIRVILPEQASGTRNTFDGLFMQAGCRHIKEIDLIYAADDRVPKCITLRADGVVTEVAEPYGTKMVELLQQSAPGTIAVMTNEVYIAFRDVLELLPVNGVLPSDAAIERFDYDMATPDFFYFKRAHMRNNAGQGVVRGIREFMAELTHEELMSHGGAFTKLGLVALSPAAQEAERSKVRTLKRFVR